MPGRKESAEETAKNDKILVFLDEAIEKLMHMTRDDGNGNGGQYLAAASLIQARALHLAYVRSVM